jgi:hypothetical protein
MKARQAAVMIVPHTGTLVSQSSALEFARLKRVQEDPGRARIAWMERDMSRRRWAWSGREVMAGKELGEMARCAWSCKKEPLHKASSLKRIPKHGNQGLAGIHWLPSVLARRL